MKKIHEKLRVTLSLTLHSILFELGTRYLFEQCIKKLINFNVMVFQLLIETLSNQKIVYSEMYSNCSHKLK